MDARKGKREQSRKIKETDADKAQWIALFCIDLLQTNSLCTSGLVPVCPAARFGRHSTKTGQLDIKDSRGSGRPRLSLKAVAYPCHTQAYLTSMNTQAYCSAVCDQLEPTSTMNASCFPVSPACSNVACPCSGDVKTRRGKRVTRENGAAPVTPPLLTTKSNSACSTVERRKRLSYAERAMRKSNSDNPRIRTHSAT